MVVKLWAFLSSHLPPLLASDVFGSMWHHVTCMVIGVTINLAAYNQPGMRVYVVASGYHLLHEVRVRPADVILQSEHEHAVAHQDCGSRSLVFALNCDSCTEEWKHDSFSSCCSTSHSWKLPTRCSQPDETLLARMKGSDSEMDSELTSHGKHEAL